MGRGFAPRFGGGVRASVGPDARPRADEPALRLSRLRARGAQRVFRRHRVRHRQGPRHEDRGARLERSSPGRGGPPRAPGARHVSVRDPGRHHPRLPRSRLDRRARLRGLVRARVRPSRAGTDGGDPFGGPGLLLLAHHVPARGVRGARSQNARHRAAARDRPVERGSDPALPDPVLPAHLGAERVGGPGAAAPRARAGQRGEPRT